MRSITLFRIFFIVVLIASVAKAQAQIITTFAGNGTLGYTVIDGGPATDAELWLPFGVTADGSGNVYIADYGSCRIRKVSTTGTISTIAGFAPSGAVGDGGPATAATLDDPVKVALDSSGNIYIADMGYNAVRKVSVSGVISTIAGIDAGGSGAGAYSGDGGPATAAELNQPLGVAVDAAGNVYIADAGNNRIRKINTAGMISTIAGTTAYGFSGDGGPATAAELKNCSGVFVAANGTIYIADAGNSCIRMINPSGTISTIAGNSIPGYTGDGGQATAAQLNRPSQMAFDNSGNMYIADYENFCIRKVSVAGIITTFAGRDSAGYGGDGAAATLAVMNSPQDVAVDNNGNVFIADFINHRIRKVSLASMIVTAVSNIGETINMYPNPVTSQLTIQSTNQPITQITLTNLLGQTLYTNTYNTQKAQIDVAGLPTGVYFIKINRSEVRKFVKE